MNPFIPADTFPNSVEPDETACNKLSNLDLHYAILFWILCRQTYFFL